MSKPLLTSRKALFAVVVVLLVTSLLPSGKAWYIAAAPTWVAETLSVPVSWPISKLAHTIRSEDEGRVENVTETEFAERLAAFEQENRRLWRINKDLQESLEALEAIVIIRDLGDIKPVEAAVVSYNNDRNNPVMLLGRGSRSGVQLGDPIVYKTNLLGFVVEVDQLNCKAELISRPEYRIRAALQPPGATQEPWPIIDYVTTADDGQSFFVDLRLGHNLQKDDIVWVYDDLHEQAYGFLLGRVAAVANPPDREHEFDRIVIRPDVPIGPQGRVMIITERQEE